MSTFRSQRTVIGPLTTTWTPPARCTIPIFLNVLEDQGFQAQSCSSGAPGDVVSCWPPVSTGAITNSKPFNGWGFYSPGLVCPHGYTSACSTVTNGPSVSAWQMEYPLIDGETAVGCCPSGYTCNNKLNAQTCHSIASGQVTFEAATCSNTDILTITMAVPLLVTVTDHSTYVSLLSKHNLYAPMFEIRWQSKDLAANFTSMSTTSTTTGTATGTSTSHRSGLSIGAIIAIGVIVPVVVITAIVLGLMLLRRRRRRGGQASPLPSNYTAFSQPLNRSMGEVVRYTDQGKNGSIMHELDNSGGRYELGANNGVASELEGS